jgi:hypothetical protein
MLEVAVGEAVELLVGVTVRVWLPVKV